MAKKAVPPEIDESGFGILRKVATAKPRSRVSDLVAEAVRLIGMQVIAAGVFRRRLLFGALTIAAVSIVSFVLSDLTPHAGAALPYVQDASPSTETPRMMAAHRVLEQDHGLDRPLPVRYLSWAAGFLRGDLGHALYLNVPLDGLLLYRLPLSAGVFLATLACTCLLAMATATYSITHLSTIGNRTIAVVGFLGLATPVLLLLPWVLYFLLSLVAAVSFYYLPWLAPFQHVAQFAYSSVSELRLWHLAAHVPVLVIVFAVSGTAGLIARAIRAALLGELARNYPINAGTDGVGGHEPMRFTYPPRSALNPIANRMPWVLPSTVLGTTAILMVLKVPTAVLLVCRVLIWPDGFQGASIATLIATLLVLSNLLTDYLLMVLDSPTRRGVA